jgi:hypothetical protein
LSAEARAQKLRRQRQGPKIQKIEHNFFLCSLISGEAKHALTLPSVRAARATGEEAKAARSLVETLGDKHTPDAQFLLAGMKSYYQPGSRSSDQLKVSGQIVDENKPKREFFILKNVLGKCCLSTGTAELTFCGSHRRTTPFAFRRK